LGDEGRFTPTVGAIALLVNDFHPHPTANDLRHDFPPKLQRHPHGNGQKVDADAENLHSWRHCPSPFAVR
jgi:hypothetical protein